MMQHESTRLFCTSHICRTLFNFDFISVKIQLCTYIRNVDAGKLIPINMIYISNLAEIATVQSLERMHVKCKLWHNKMALFYYTQGITLVKYRLVYFTTSKMSSYFKKSCSVTCTQGPCGEHQPSMRGPSNNSQSGCNLKKS